MYCKNCGAELRPDAAFCENCGAAAKATVPPSAPTQKPVYAQPTQPQRKSGAKTGIIILVVVVLLAITALWLTGVIGGEDKSEMPPTQEMLPAETPEPSAAEDSETDEAQLSTTQTPTPEDFAWFTNNAASWMFGSSPSGAKAIGTADRLDGSWKGMEMIYDYDGTVLGYGFFTLTFVTSSTDGSITAALDWHYMNWSDGTTEQLTDWPDESLAGVFEVPTFSFGYPGSMITLYCYELNGKQYAEGTWEVQSGEEVRVALVRP